MGSTRHFRAPTVDGVRDGREGRARGALAAVEPLPVEDWHADLCAIVIRASKILRFKSPAGQEKLTGSRLFWCRPCRFDAEVLGHRRRQGGLPSFRE